MKSPQFDIIFRGDIIFGHQLADVKINLQQLFKADAVKVDALFTGRPIPLKRNLDEVTANKYRDALVKAGALVDLCPSDTATSPTASVITPVAQAATKTDVKDAGEWTVAPAGTRLLPPSNSPDTPPQVDTSGLSLRPLGSNLLDRSEVEQTNVTPVIAPEFDVAELGADMTGPDERLALPIVEFEFDWDIAELGSDLLQPDEQLVVVPVAIDVNQFNLAPVGTDLGQVKPEVNIVVPDISHITLIDSGDR